MTTPNLGLTLPTPGASNDTWGTTLNADLTAIDTAFDEAVGHNHSGVVGSGGPLPPSALVGLPSPGLVVAAGASFNARAIVAGSGVGVVNGDGQGGNPTLTLNIPGMSPMGPVVADDDLFPVSDTSAGPAPRSARRDEALARAKIVAPRMAVDVKGAVSGAVAMDTGLFSYFAMTLNGATTFSFTNPPGAALGLGVVVEITNGGSFGVTWPASVKWPAGVAPALSPAGVDVLVFLTRDGGVTWRGVLSMQDSL